LEKLLEDAGIKLSSVATDISGVSGRAMLAALVAGERDPGVLADLAKRRLRSKIPELTEALTGRFGEHHAFLTRLHLDLIDQHTTAINELTARIEVVIAPFRRVRDLIVTIPGISNLVADVIIAETGGDMTRFPTAGHLASWAGTCPGSNESAGRCERRRYSLAGRCRYSPSGSWDECLVDRLSVLLGCGVEEAVELSGEGGGGWPAEVVGDDDDVLTAAEPDGPDSLDGSSVGAGVGVVDLDEDLGLSTAGSAAG